MKKLLLLPLFFISVAIVSQVDFLQLGADIDGEAAGDLSGSSVSMNAAGDRVAIGASINNNGNGVNAGHVRIYDWNGTAWTQLGTDIDGEAANDRSGSSVSMNAAGDRVAIGAFGNGVNAGHVRIYDWNGTAWTQLGTDIDGEAAGDLSGSSVSMNATGDRVAIGAWVNSGNALNAGHVRIYQWYGTTWAQLGSDIDGEAVGDRSGFSVSMNASGDRVGIGATKNDGPVFVQSGHVRIYDWNGTAWTQLGSDIDGEAAGDSNGWSVSLSSDGNTVAIGATENDGNTGNFSDNRGHVRIYKGGPSVSITEVSTQINIYPNPTNEEITILIDNFTENIKTEVYDIIGNRLQTTNKTTISLRNYARGVYILKVAYGDKVKEVKVIKD
jgi:hypothetical protein